jgi:hypothetical protein
MAKLPPTKHHYFFTELPHLTSVATKYLISQTDAEAVRTITNSGRRHIPNDYDLLHPLNHIHMLVLQIRARSSSTNEEDKYKKEGLTYKQKRDTHKELNKRTKLLLEGLVALDTDVVSDWQADGKFASDNNQKSQSKSIILLMDLLTILEQTTKDCSKKSNRDLYMTTSSQNTKLGIDAALPLLANIYIEATGKTLSNGTFANSTPAERFFESSLALMGFDANNEFCRKKIRAINKGKSLSK